MVGRTFSNPIFIGIIQGVTTGIHLLVSKAVAANCDPVAYAFAYLLAANLLVLCGVAMSGRMAELRITRRQLMRIVYIGTVNTGIQLLTVMGVYLSSATGAGVLVRTDMLFSLLLGYLFFRERVHATDITGSTLMLWGVVWVMNLVPGMLFSELSGDLCLLAAGFLIAENGMFIRHKLMDVPGRAIAFYNTLVASALMGLAMAVTGRSAGLTTLVGYPAVWGLLGAGASYGLSLLTYYAVLEVYPVWLTRAFLLVSPVVAAIGGWWFFAERLSVKQIIGCVLVMAGMAVMFFGRALQQRYAAMQAKVPPVCASAYADRKTG